MRNESDLHTKNNRKFHYYVERQAIVRNYYQCPVVGLLNKYILFVYILIMFYSPLQDYHGIK